MLNDIAQALADRLTTFVQDGVLTEVVGLVRTLATDITTEGEPKKHTFPVPDVYPLTNPETEWRRLFPDPEKTAVVWFEAGRSSIGMSNGQYQILNASLKMVVWYNAAKYTDQTNIGSRLKRVLIGQMVPVTHTRNVPVSPGSLFYNLKLKGLVEDFNDPFTKYTGFNVIDLEHFNFKTFPYGWFVVDLQVTAYAKCDYLVSTL